MGVLDAAEQDVFLRVLIVCTSGVGGVGSWDVSTWAYDGVVSTWAEVEGVCSAEGVAGGPPENGGGGEMVSRGCSRAYGRRGYGVQRGCASDVCGVWVRAIVLVDFLPHCLIGGEEGGMKGEASDGFELWVQAPEFVL